MAFFCAHETSAPVCAERSEIVRILYGARAKRVKRVNKIEWLDGQQKK